MEHCNHARVLRKLTIVLRDLAIILVIGLAIFSVAFFVVMATEMYLIGGKKDLLLFAAPLAVIVLAFGSVQILDRSYK
jgi:hypothetical protein